jgi:hypothetical protein
MCSEFTTTLAFDPGYTNPPFGLENESGLLRFVEACMSQGKNKARPETVPPCFVHNKSSSSVGHGENA